VEYDPVSTVLALARRRDCVAPAFAEHGLASNCAGIDGGCRRNDPAEQPARLGGRARRRARHGNGVLAEIVTPPSGH
jgi:hypothetical protein